MSILTSIYSLAKNRNGLFKSEKQQKFLSEELDFRNGIAGHDPNGRYSVHVEWDQYGITKILHLGEKSRKFFTNFERRGIVENDIMFDMMCKTYDDLNNRKKEFTDMYNELNQMRYKFQKFNLEEDKLLSVMDHLDSEMREYHRQVNEYWDGTLTKKTEK